MLNQRKDLCANSNANAACQGYLPTLLSLREILG